MSRSQSRVLICVLMTAVCLTFAAGTAGGQPAGDKSAAEWIDEFSQSWDESKWEKSFRGVSGGYMRPSADDQWKKRMLALRGVVLAGTDSIPALLETLSRGKDPERIFAAQALGYLASDVPTQALLDAFKDPHPAVRLYLADALGRKGDASIDLAGLSDEERNRDVRKHLFYAIERKGEPVKTAVIEQLKNWDTDSIDSATVGMKAPGFELEAATGEKIRLSDFKGKSTVVLVFVYGDT